MSLPPGGIVGAWSEVSKLRRYDISGADITALVLSVMAVAGLGWYFFAPRKGRIAAPGDGVQKIAVRVKGGYSPKLIHVRQGVPLEIEFDRQESGECTNRVVFARPRRQRLPTPYTKTTIRLRPDRTGTFGFACGMNMIHGTLVVDPADETTDRDSSGANDCSTRRTR